MSAGAETFRIRRAVAGDLDQLIELDARITGQRKAKYWRDLYERFQARRPRERFIFLAEPVAKEDVNEPILGFVTGEVRAFEFGSEPCGWVFAIAVDPQARETGLGEALLATISQSFKQAGVRTLRTMVSRSNHLLMSFFRSEGLTAGPYLELEKELE